MMRKQSDMLRFALRRIVREAIDEHNVDPALSIDKLDEFRDKVSELVNFAEKFGHPLWDALGDVIIDAIAETPEFIALEKAIEPSGM